MSTEVKVPAVGESISTGVVSVWHKKSGEQVSAGDPLFTLETDKGSTEINAEKDGVLQTLVAEGAEVKIGDVVATIEEGTASDAKAEKKAEPAGKKPEAQKDAPAEKSSTALSPAARRVVTEEKLDPQEIRGTGKGGRVTKNDAVTAAQNRAEARTAEPPAAKAKDDHAEEKQPQPVQSESGRFTRKKMSPLRRKIAAQLVMAQHTAAILTTFNECDMTAVQELRAKSQDAFTKKNGLKLGFMSFFIKAGVEGLEAVR